MTASLAYALRENSLAYALREKLISCKNNFKDISLKLTSMVRYGPSTPLLRMSKKNLDCGNRHNWRTLSHSWADDLFFV